MARIQQQDTAAFEELYARYSKRLLAFMCKMLGNEHRAQDLLQDLFLKIVERPQLFNADKRFYTWVFTVAANMCRNEYRNNNRQVISTEKIAHTEHAYTEALVGHVDASLFTAGLGAALDTLGHEEKETFVLRFQQGFSIQEIAEMMDCPEGTVKSRIYYVTRKLAGELQAFKPLLKQ